ncbi:MAG: hypothetical protein Q7S06_04000 [Nanoarchaeota archaeon]|nr:hypothetical protein [Nanoarchaeota archaeon]
MKKRAAFLLIFVLLFSILNFSLSYAQDETVSDDTTTTEPEVSEQTQEQTTTEIPGETTQEEIPETTTTEETSEVIEKAEEEFKDAELEANSGITPDSGFYFVEDGILSKFRGDLENREKKIAEIKAMVEAGNIDAARESLERYGRYAENLEKEANPERRDDALRSAVAIRKTINKIKSEIPEEERDDFSNVLEKEGAIVTATEIASKIKELCETLSKLDPLEYSRVCKTEGDSPRWQKDMNQKLTAEQEKEAKEFFEIMSQCFETSGRKCRCEDISVSAFSEKCSTISPLAAACDEGNKDACDKMEKIEEEEPIEDLLPDYLQDVLSRLEGKYDEDRYDISMPPECVKEGANGRQCIELMFRRNAPGPCLNALDRGEISFTNEKEAREACEKIMFEGNAPSECIEAGATNPKECGKIMFKLNAPEECVEAGLTGENRGDEKKCREIMERAMGEKPGRGPERGFGGGNCKAIQDSMKRLECYDSASQGMGERFERVETERKEVREYRQEEGQKCPDNICDEFEKTHSYACPEDCGGVRESREEQEEREEFRPPQEEFQQPPEGQPPKEGTMPPETTSPESITTTTTEPAPETSSGGEGGSSSGETTPTGAIISNEFYDYYYRIG